ncbi:MAG: ParA family protein [Pseudomonadota bacterium]
MIVAVYSLKGGVGKTTLAVNLAWAAATLSSRRTLLWDLDGQAAATWVLGHDEATGKGRAQDAITGTRDPRKLIVPTATDRLDLLPADASLCALDLTFHALDKKKRLAKVAADLARDYDRVIIDCPPGLTDTSDQILRAADLVVVPVIPAPLARRALDTLKAHVAAKKGGAVKFAPVFAMVDRRRGLHRAALEQEPGWPVIPMASAYETMTDKRAPLGSYAARGSPAVEAVAELWRRVERALVK